jgi:predicted ATPase
MAFGSFLEPWARSDASGRDARVEEMRRGIAILQEQGVSLYGPLLWTALARAETEVGEIDAALATVDRAIIETERTDQRWFESETHRIRGRFCSNAIRRTRRRQRKPS